MSNLYLKIDKVEDVSVLNDGYKIMRAFTKDDFFHFLVKDGEAPETLDLDKHEESIRELLRSVRKMDMNDKIKVFDHADVYSIMDAYTIGEIREKYEAWENRPKIGDEVSYNSDVGIIISFTKVSGTDYIRVFAKGENSIFCFPPDKVKKTGRHFDNVSIGDLGRYAEETR